MKQFADQDQKVRKVALDDGENQETEGDQATLEDPGQKDLLVNTDQSDLKDRWVWKGHPGPAGPRGLPGQKGVKGEPGKSISAPSLLQRPVETTVNESQTAILKCVADGNPTPQVTWYKLNSSLPPARYVEEGADWWLSTTFQGDGFWLVKFKFDYW